MQNNGIVPKLVFADGVLIKALTLYEGDPRADDLRELVEDLLSTVNTDDWETFEILRKLYPARWLRLAAHEIRLTWPEKYACILNWLQSESEVKIVQKLKDAIAQNDMTIFQNLQIVFSSERLNQAVEFCENYEKTALRAWINFIPDRTKIRVESGGRTHGWIGTFGGWLFDNPRIAYCYCPGQIKELPLEFLQVVVQ